MNSTFTHLFKLSQGISLEFSILSRKSIVSKCLEDIGKMLKGALGNTELNLFMLSVDEVLQNAYEHGNLELSNEEKRSLLEQDLLDTELKKREEKFFHRTISIKLEIKNEVLSICVTDEGNGFDWRKTQIAIKDQTSLHGRGLSIIQAATDRHEFNEAGNSVKLIRSLKRAKGT